MDVFAPGVAILSAVSNKGDDGTAIKTGTSMAAPFVTGVVAAYLETHPVSDTPALVLTAVVLLLPLHNAGLFGSL